MVITGYADSGLKRNQMLNHQMIQKLRLNDEVKFRIISSDNEKRLCKCAKGLV